MANSTVHTPLDNDTMSSITNFIGALLVVFASFEVTTYWLVLASLTW